MRKIAIIGGTGIDNPDTLKGFEKKIIETPFGKALCNIGTMSGNQVVFVSRHGVDHSVPPHKVNYRANIWAMKSLGTEEIFATTAVGSLNPEMKAGHFVVCDNVLDFTKSRNVIIAALIMSLSLGINFSNAGAIKFALGNIDISLSGLAVGALTGIILNAILPGKDYKFDEDKPDDTGVCFAVKGQEN